jgi:signal transduction histidine kinase/CheY-like chemotaxis protein
MAKSVQGLSNFSQPGPDETATHPPRLHVLVVEDMEENLLLLLDVFAESGYDVTGARNGQEALERIASSSVDLIVADAMMPKMDGFQLCKEVRAHPRFKTVPFVIYTGNYIDAADEAFARNVGVDRYVVKTGGVDPLVDAVNVLAEERYGTRNRPGSSGNIRMDDQSFLEQHHAIIIKKLEEKMAELETYARTLEQKNREIQTSEDRYRDLFDHASIAICVVDRATGRILDANRRASELLKYSRPELYQLPRLPFGDHTIAPSGYGDLTEFFTGEATVVTKQGELRHVDVGVGPMTEPDDDKVLLYLRDITERLRLRDQLLQAEKLSLMGRIAAGIAHEIRNPLSAVTINLQYLLQKHGADPSLRQSVLDALEGTQRVTTVVENTLNLARISAPNAASEQVNDLVAQVMMFLRMSVRNTGVRIEQALTGSLPAVTVNPRQVQQAILNIVQNAIDASPQQGVVTIATMLTKKTPDGRGPWVTIAVHDEGPGIARDQQTRLFEVFYTTKPGGTGLGLTLSKEIMERHSGDILIESERGKGTTVSLLFPAEPV